ncbi:hypothetical protein HDV05_003102, partial [Chytridiales sp. JEL 0842]
MPEKNDIVVDDAARTLFLEMLPKSMESLKPMLQSLISGCSSVGDLKDETQSFLEEEDMDEDDIDRLFAKFEATCLKSQHEPPETLPPIHETIKPQKIQDPAPKQAKQGKALRDRSALKSSRVSKKVTQPSATTTMDVPSTTTTDTN